MNFLSGTPHSFAFWKAWPVFYRRLWISLAITGVLGIAIGSVYAIRGYDNVIRWGTREEQKILESTVHEFTVGSFTISIPADNYIILKYFSGGPITPNLTASYLSLALIFAGAVLLISLITTLDRFWSIVGTVIFLLFLYSLRLQSLLLFGAFSYVPTAILGSVLLGLSAFFSIVKNKTPFFIRLLSFSLVFVTAAVLIYLFSEVEKPFLYLNVTVYPAAMLMALLFVLLVAHEIPAWITVMTASGGSGGRNISHFLIFCLIYLANILIAALHRMDIIHWDFVYVNPLFLLIISTALGVWGFRERESLYGSILPFNPFGAILYLSLALVCFGALIQFFGNMNDAALRIIEDIILFAHFGYGLLFIMYVASNFLDLLGHNVPVGRVLYQPKRMPYMSYQLAGLITTLVFVFYVGWREYTYDGVGGFYNQLGDLDVTLNNGEYARAHYEQARSYAFRDHHSNYAMGTFRDNGYDIDGALPYYQRANAEKPTEYSLINEGNTFLWSGKKFEPIRSFRQSLDQLPNSGRIQNNLGIAYGKIFNLDSSLYFLEEARKQGVTKAAAETNFLAFLATESIPIKADSVVQLFSNDTGVMANALGLANVQNQPLEIPVDPYKEGRLNLYEATLLNNYLVRHIKQMDTTELQKAFRIASDSLNSDFEEALKVPIASAFYFWGNVSKAFEIMAGLIFRSKLYEGSYNYMQGLWALEQGNPQAAAHYFDYALVQKYKKAQLYHAIALSEMGDLPRAWLAWDSLSRSADAGEQLMGRNMMHLLTLPYQNALGADDNVKYQFSHYRLSVYDSIAFDRLLRTYSQPQYRNWALYEMARRQFEWGNKRLTSSYLNQLGTTLVDPALEYAVKRLRLLSLCEQKDVLSLQNELSDGFVYFKEDQAEQKLVTALLHESKGDTLTAGNLFLELGTFNPFFEEGVIAAADYFRTHGEDPMHSYTLLSEAIQLNTTSPKLYRAYIDEAFRVGFSWYAASALEQLKLLLESKSSLVP